MDYTKPNICKKQQLSQLKIGEIQHKMLQQGGAIGTVQGGDIIIPTLGTRPQEQQALVSWMHKQLTWEIISWLRYTPGPYGRVKAWEQTHQGWRPYTGKEYGRKKDDIKIILSDK